MENKSDSVILNGGVVDSRRLSADKYSRIPDMIRKAVGQVNASLTQSRDIELEIIRMDRFLGLITDKSSALRAALMLITAVKVSGTDEINELCNLKLVLATGAIEYRRNTLRESDGTAIRLAMEAFEKMGKSQRLLIITGDKKTNEYFRVVCSFMDSIIQGWSQEQAEALFLSLQGSLQIDISKELNISQPAVNRRLKAAQWNAVEQFVRLYEKTI